jgi:hypothetical protein
VLRLEGTVIATNGRDFSVVSTLFYRDSTPGEVGRQCTWVKFAEGRKMWPPRQDYRRAETTKITLEAGRIYLD